MKLYFKPAELLLEEFDGGYVLKMGEQILGKFRHAKRAVSEYNRIRTELEAKMPPPEVSESERRKLLQEHIGDSLVQHNSLRTPMKKITKTRTFG